MRFSEAVDSSTVRQPLATSCIAPLKLFLELFSPQIACETAFSLSMLQAILTIGTSHSTSSLDCVTD